MEATAAHSFIHLRSFPFMPSCWPQITSTAKSSPSFSSSHCLNFSNFRSNVLKSQRFPPPRASTDQINSNPSKDIAILLEVEGVLADVNRVANRQAFNSAFQTLGLDCANWTEPIYADLTRKAGGDEERMVTLFFNRIGWPSSLPTNEKDIFVKSVLREKQKALEDFATSSNVSLRPGVETFIDDALKDGVPVVFLTAYSRHGHKFSRSIIEKLGHDRISKSKIVGKEEVEGSLYGQLVLGKGVSSSLDEKLATEQPQVIRCLFISSPLDPLPLPPPPPMTTSPALPLVFALGLASLLLTSAGDVAGFGYGKGPNGPENWGSLKPEWKTCSSGSMQSPINLDDGSAELDGSLQPLTRDYADAKATLVNNGFNVELRYDEGVGSALIDGKKYSLQQLHWHTPSEHTIDMVRFPLEMHMVHKSTDGKIAVVAVLYKLGRSDKFTEQLMGKLKELAKEKCGEEEEAHVPVGVVESKMLRRSTRKYYRYSGSLTAPPCSEGVSWTILGKVRQITPEQLAALQAPLSGEYRNNSRPMQPLKGRLVKVFKETKKDNDSKKDDDADEDDDDDDDIKPKSL